MSTIVLFISVNSHNVPILEDRIKVKFIVINDWVINIILNHLQYNLYKKTGKCIIYFTESLPKLNNILKVLSSTQISNNILKVLTCPGFGSTVQVMYSQELQSAEVPPYCVQSTTSFWIAKECHTLALNSRCYSKNSCFTVGELSPRSL